jgi:hypothetical protein
MRWRALTICCGLLLPGCQLYWTRPGATYADFTAAHQACLREVGMATPSDPDTVLVNEDAYKACLRTNGWQRVEDGTVKTQAGRFRGIETSGRVRLDSVPEQVPWGQRN